MVVRGFVMGAKYKVFFSCRSLIGVWVYLLGWWEMDFIFIF